MAATTRNMRSGHNTEKDNAAIAAPPQTPRAGRPVATVWDALERADCRPRGPEQSFMARCPAHDDHDPSLSVTEGGDGRVLLHCFAGCEIGAILAALGLTVVDLFVRGSTVRPRGRAGPTPRSARATAPVDLPPAERLVRVLRALDACGTSWQAQVMGPDCPVCGAQRLWITAAHERQPTLSCPAGCDQVDIERALAERARQASGRPA
jgi:hypothetical protein